MERRPTLAEILADETGKIRPEVADLLMEPDLQRVHQRVRPRPVHPHQRRPPVPQPQRRPLRWGWVVAGVISIIIVAVISHFEDAPHSTTTQTPSVDGGPRSSHVESPAAPVVASQKHDSVMMSTAVDPKPVAEPSPTVEAGPVVAAKPATVASKQDNQNGRITKKGRVVAENVNLREQPGLRSPVIRVVNQGDNLDVISFQDGWYGVLLENQKTAYIFGAFLLPLNFNSSPYLVGMRRDRSRVLVKDENNNAPYYQLIMADGQKALIKRDDVSLFYP